MHCQTEPPGKTTISSCETMFTGNHNVNSCADPTASGTTIPAIDTQLSATANSTSMDQAALSFMSKLFPDVSSIYTQAISKGNFMNNSSETGSDVRAAVEWEKDACFYPHTNDILGITSPGLLPFNPFPFAPGSGNLAFVTNNMLPRNDGDIAPFLSDPRNSNITLNAMQNQVIDEQLKNSTTSQVLLQQPITNNDNNIPQNEVFNSTLHSTTKNNPNSMNEIANLFQLSSMNAIPFSSFNSDSMKSKGLGYIFPTGQPMIQMSSKTDEDFCELCQKHFCNKYYLRKHKADVHGIHTEPYSLSRRRESLTTTNNNNNSPKYCTIPQTLVNNSDRVGMNQAGFLHGGSNSNNTNKLSNLTKENYQSECDQQLSDQEATPISNTETFTTVNDANFTRTLSSLPTSYPNFPITTNPMDYASVLKETFMFNAIQSKLPSAAAAPSNLVTGDSTSPAFPCVPIAPNLPIPMNGVDSMLSAHYYMIALMSTLPPGMAQEMTSSTENMPPQLEHIPSLSNAESSIAGIREVQCDQCHKVFCNQYFLQVHKANQHAMMSETAGDPILTEKNESTTERFVGDRTSAAQRLEISDEYSKGLDFDIQSHQLVDQTARFQGSASILPDRLNSSTSGMNTQVTTNQKTASKIIPNSLDVFKSSMVAAKLADRVTCEFCKKELCNKYFLRTHKIRVHGVSPKDVGGPPMRNPPVVTSMHQQYNHQHQQQQQQQQLHDSTGTTHSSLDVVNAILPTSQSSSGSNPITSYADSSFVMADVTKSSTSESFSEIFGALHMGFPSTSMTNSLLPLPYWSMMPQPNSERNTIVPPVNSLPSSTVYASPNSSMLNLYTTSPAPPVPPLPPSSTSTTPFPNESSGILPLGLTGSDSLSATAVISCPICEQTVGPRLFLPSHLSTVHALNPLDPVFFLTMLRAKAIPSLLDGDKPTWNVSGTEQSMVVETPQPQQQQRQQSCVNFPLTMPTLAQEELPNTFKVDNMVTSAADQRLVTSNSLTSLKTLPEGERSPKLCIRSSSCDTAITSTVECKITDSLNAVQLENLGISPEVQIPKLKQIADENAFDNNVFASTASMPTSPVSGKATSVTETSVVALPLEMPNRSSLTAYVPGVSIAAGITPMTTSANASIAAAAAAAAAAAFSSFPVNPIEAVVAAMAAASGGQWNPSSNPSSQSVIGHVVPQGPASSSSSTSSAPPMLNSGTQSTTGLLPSTALPRKSPNQMRVLCDICNKWICNKYFLRTHRANKHGITDNTSLSSPMDGYKSIQAKLSGLRVPAAFRNALVPPFTERGTANSMDAMELNSQESSSNKFGEITTSPRATMAGSIDMTSEIDKTDSQEKLAQAWKMAYEIGGPQSGRDLFGCSYPIPMATTMPTMLIPGFGPVPMLNSLNSSTNPNSLMLSPMHYMLPVRHALEFSSCGAKVSEPDQRRAQDVQGLNEQDDSSDMLTKSMVQTDSPVEEKTIDLKLQLPLNLSLKPSSTPMKRRHLGSTPDSTLTQTCSAGRSKFNRRCIILNHLRRAKRFSLHSFWRRKHTKQDIQHTRSILLASKATRKDDDRKTRVKRSKVCLKTKTKSKREQFSVDKTQTMNTQNTSMVPSVNGYTTHFGDLPEPGLDTILVCPLCPVDSALHFATLNPLLQHIALVHGNSTTFNSTAAVGTPITDSHNSQRPIVQQHSNAFQVRQLASDEFADTTSKDLHLIPVTLPSNIQNDLLEKQQASTCASDSSFNSPEPVVTSNTHVHSLPTSAALHRPMFIPINSYTETLSTI